MGEVLDLKRPRPGERSFLTCGCGKGDTMAVVVMHDAQGAFICGVVCPECNTETPISFGRPIRAA